MANCSALKQTRAPMSLNRDDKQRALIQIVAGMLAASSPKEGGPDPQDLAQRAMAYLNALLDQFPDQQSSL